VLVDGAERGRIIARSSADAPEIDGHVIVSGAKQAAPGDFLQVRVTRAGEHDLWAQAI